MSLFDALPKVLPLDAALAAQLRAKVDGLAKPPGSLGRIEDLAVRIGLVQERLDPRIRRTRAYVFAGDHGLNAEHVSAYPSSVTTAMVATFLAGRASVNALARACDVEVRVVDAGVDAVLPPHLDLIEAKVRRGSRNCAVEAALTADEVEECLIRGAEIAHDAAEEGVDAIAIGEMGIGNSASAALLMHVLAPAPLEDCVGLGAGQTPNGLQHKLVVLRRAAERVSPKNALEALSEFGGLEIAMMVGAILGAAGERRIVLVDGFISSAAALVAVRLAPAVLDYCIFSHSGAEKGHRLLLASMGGSPALLDLGLRLGEGSGAVLAAPLLRAAAGLLTETASLADVLA